MHQINHDDLLNRYDRWAEERRELSEAEPHVDPDAWHGSDDTAVDLLHDAAGLLRGSAPFKAPVETTDSVIVDAEHEIVVIFDVCATSRIKAAYAVAEVLDGTPGTKVRDTEEHEVITDNRVESWWFPEGDLKPVDGNDRDAMELVPEDGDTTGKLRNRERCEWVLDDIAAAIDAAETPAEAVHQVAETLRVAGRR